MTTKPTHGGRRAHAGRPAIYKDRTKISVVLESELARWVEREARRRGVSRSRLVQECIEGMRGK